MHCNVDVLIEAGPRIAGGVQLVCTDAGGFYSRIYGMLKRDIMIEILCLTVSEYVCLCDKKNLLDMLTQYDYERSV